ncbi:hypothetical protein HYFRA_00008738 [Hymenoscyphus fraxineus]|uniref:BTB domain-containing protein n=1 Tax=Hymenoscyphus fraxineus TaxID=746836 RepID=A0A9N9L0E3_9HELO|nr:hypothetical protein HYFRA_00008738 [Hymenoscyphus fraxineus]
MTSNPSNKRPRPNSDVQQAPSKPPAPIVFRKPGEAVDTLLSALGQDYHVHSSILKLHSNYFRKFLDSPDKSGKPASPQFRYHYVTVIDRDDAKAWFLESSEKGTPATADQLAGLTDKNQQSDAFSDLLKAMYHRPFKIHSYSHLEAMSTIADIYCALPVLSTALSGALLGSRLFEKNQYLGGSRDCTSEFLRKEHEIIFIAKRLRNADLFRECLIVIAGKWLFEDGIEPWHTKYKAVANDPKLLKLIQRESENITRKMAKVDHEILLLVLRIGWRPNAEFGSREPDLAMGTPEPSEPSFYYNVKARLDHPEGDSDFEVLEFELDKILENNLVFDRTHDRPGDYQGVFNNALLCARIQDEDLPWCLSEVDW